MMVRDKLAVVLTASLAAACARAAGPGPTEGDPPRYEVMLTAEEADGIRVVVRFARTPRLLRMSGNGAGQLPDGWATFVHDMSAVDGTGAALRVEKAGPREWRLEDRPADGLTLTYAVRLAHDSVTWPGGIDGAALRLPWGVFFSGRAVFVLPDSVEGPFRVAFRAPPGWNIAAGWPAVPGRKEEFEVPTPAALTESYAFVGAFEGFEIRRQGLDLSFALGGPTVTARADEFRSTAEDVVAYFTRTLGGAPRPAPGQSSGRVLAIINEGNVTDGEVIGSHINILLEPDPDPLGLLFSRFGLVHELFHLWNGKSIRSDGPEDWFSEGFTNYYALKAMRNTGMLDDAATLDVIADVFHARYVSDAGYGTLSMREAVDEKDDHWGLIYGGGLFTAICQDVEIRRSTGNARSLDDVMRVMYGRFAGSGRTFGVEDVREAIAAQSGHDPSGFFARHVLGPEPIPIAECLSRVGLEASVIEGRLSIQGVTTPGEPEAGILAGLLGAV
jgi:predicted metalloprotease with PDZ domain